ncbi:MAG: alpha/beta fold hydrolase [Wenzhouxiangellaceae bacterium]|nr:alpha/beta fold hydrolase [Wenzhouxiangellaceae bacterium]
MNERTQPDPEKTEPIAADGYPIASTRYATDGAPRGRVVIAGATGVGQGFYRHFAAFAQAYGLEAITLDYRGVGKSAPETLKGFDMNFLDWARLDLAAIVNAVPEDELPLYLVGHSYGGHALGLLPNHRRVTASALCATGSGWHGWMPWPDRLRLVFFWNVIGPVLTRLKGYLPFKMLRMGEDLPLPVYRQWRRWCHNPDYFFDDPELADELTGFARVRCPIVAINATDDGWAPPRSRDVFMRHYENAPVQAVDLEPADIDLESIGHIDYFRPRARPLWQPMLDWLEQPDAPFRIGQGPPLQK